MCAAKDILFLLARASVVQCSLTSFSFRPCLKKVEYAIEAINNAGTCVGILASDGIVMASERRITSGLLAPAKVSHSFWVEEKRNKILRRHFQLTLLFYCILAVVVRLRKRRISSALMPRATLPVSQPMPIF